MNVLFMTSWYPTRAQPVKGVFVREHAKAVRLYDNVAVLHLPEPDLTGRRASARRAQANADSDLDIPPRSSAAVRVPSLRPGPLCWLERESDEALTEGIPTWRACYRVSPTPKTSYFLYLWSAFRAVRRIVRDGFRPDVIHAHIYEAGVPAVLIGKLLGIPVVIAEHYSAFLRRTLTGGELRKARFAFRSARWVLPVSAALQRGIEGYGIPARFRIVPNAVDVSLFAPYAERRAPHDPRRLLFVGTLAPTKGLSYLLQALARLQGQQAGCRWQMDIVGEGPEREAYERQAAQLGLADSVTFHTPRSKAEVAAFMGRADLFMLPSLFETFSVVAAEALTAGLPILATACGGPEEFITPAVGRLVPPGDADALYRGLREMLAELPRYSPGLISEYAVDSFSPQRVGAALHAIYSSL